MISSKNSTYDDRLSGTSRRRHLTDSFRVLAPVVLVFAAVACGPTASTTAPTTSKSTSTSTPSPPASAAVSTTQSVPAAAPPSTNPRPAPTTPPTTDPRLSVTATLARSCSGAVHTQCVTEARAAIKNDATLAAAKCAPGAAEGCHRQFGDRLVQACYPASQVPAWGPDGWCTLVDSLEAGGMAAAETYVQGQAPAGFQFTFISPEITWSDTATLHVLHVTPQGTASYGVGGHDKLIGDGQIADR